MDISAYRDNLDPLIATVHRVLKARNQDRLADLLGRSIPSLEHSHSDNWNGGTDYYVLYLDLDAEDYAALRGDRRKLEQWMHQVFGDCTRDSHNRLASVIFRPKIEGVPPWKATQQAILTESSIEDRSVVIWDEPSEQFRLFLSHVSAHKVKLAALKVDLAMWGISAFVAHKDIEPDEDWRDDILVALTTTEALAALLTPDFHASHWTDHEVGIAFGRGVPVLAIKLGVDPYGFMGKRQAMSGDLDHTAPLAEGLVKVLLKNKNTRPRMLDALVFALGQAHSFDWARKVGDLLMTQKGLTREHLDHMWDAVEENTQVRWAKNQQYGPEIIGFIKGQDSELEGIRQARLEPKKQQIADEYDPFADD